MLDHIAEAARNLGELERAAHAHAEAMDLLSAAGCEEGVNTSYFRQARLARALGEATFAEAWQDGRVASPDRLLELAIASGASTPRSTVKSPLTPREREVAFLIGRGKSNREIADELVVSVRTAEAHVTNVLNKLGLRSRSQLAVWVAEQSLLSDERTRTVS